MVWSDCPFEEPHSIAAARSGQLHILEWLLSAGGDSNPWAKSAIAAAGEGQTHVLRWMDDQGLPIPLQRCRAAVFENGNMANQEQCYRVLEWLDKQDIKPPRSFG